MLNLNATNLDITDPDLQEAFNDLQGNILKGHGRDLSRHIFLRFVDQDGARAWIRAMADKITTALKQHTEAAEWKATGVEHLFVSLLLSSDGYRALGVDDRKMPAERAFLHGMKDLEFKYNTRPRGDHAPTANPLFDNLDDWEKPFCSEIHALVIFAYGSAGHDDADGIATLEKEVSELQTSLEGVAEIVCIQEGHVLRNDLGQVIEHFGFTDGVSDPLILKHDLDRAFENGGFEHYDPSINIGGVIVPDPGGDTESYGSFCVYRKLQQNIRGFANRIETLAEQVGVNEDLARALVMGRFQDGTPVGEQNVGGWRNEFNNFNYDDDWTGLRCPMASHTRRANPRGDTYRQFGSPESIERARRIVRRGISYGSADLSPQEEWTDAGLLFLCFQANIEDQFIFIQNTWCNNQDFLSSDVGIDPIAGQTLPGEKCVAQKWPAAWGKPQSEKNLEFSDVVRTRGGEYFFAPSITALRSI